MAKRTRLGLFANLETKIMALIMAVVLYAYARSERSGEESNVMVPLTLTLPTATMALPKVPEKIPDRVSVSFSGPQKAIEKLREVRNQIEARYEVDEKGHENEDQWTVTITLTADQMTGVPREVTVTEVVPTTLTLTIARTTEKELKVRLNLQGEPPPGFEISKAEPPAPWPGVITVTGPKKVLAGAAEINTEPIKLSSLLPIAMRFPGTARVEQTVFVKVDNQLKPEHIDCNQSVTYSITLTQVRGTQTLKKLPVRVLQPANFPYIVRLVPGNETVDVEVRGLKLSLDKLDNSNVKAYVDVADQRPTTGKPPASLPVQFALPDEVQGKVEIINEPAKMVGVDILEPAPAKDKGTLPVRP